MSGAGVMRAGGAGLAIRGVAREAARSWTFVMAIVMGATASVENANFGGRHPFGSGFFVQVLVFGSFWLRRMPSSRMLLTLPLTRRQIENTCWVISFAIPVLYYALVFGGAGVWSGWHGRRAWPTALMILDGVALQGLLVLAWSFGVDSAGRIGWPGWTRRSAMWLGIPLGAGGVLLCLSPGILPKHDAPASLAVALAAGLPAALLVSLRRDMLLKLYAATANDDEALPGTARGWSAYGKVLLPTFWLTLACAMLVPGLMVALGRDVVRISPVVVVAPQLLAFALPIGVMRGLRVVRLLPVSPAKVSALLMAGMAWVPCATCLILAGAFGTASALHMTASIYVSWIMPAGALNLLALPIALRFERLWLMGALAAAQIAGFAMFLVFATHGALPRMPLAVDLGACLGLTGLCFVWLRHEIFAARGIRLRVGFGM